MSVLLQMELEFSSESVNYREELINILKKAWESGVGKNAAALYLIHFANYFLPLITVPYLVRVLGPSHFGLVAFAQGMIAYFSMFVDYGFGLSATRRISIERKNLWEVSRIASSVWAAKCVLCLSAFATLLLLVNSVPKLEETRALMLILYGVVFGGALFPTWLFQGMERMFFISAINLGMRSLVLVGIFALVRQHDDYLVYAGIISFESLGAGIVGMVIAITKFKLKPVVPSRRDICKALREGWNLFLSTASISLYTAGNAFILGLLTNSTAVGYYSAAEKVVKGVMGILGPVSQAIYPRFSKLVIESERQALYWGKRMLLIMGGMGGLISILLFCGAPIIVEGLLGREYMPSIGVMRLLALLPLLIGLSNVLGIQIMLPFGSCLLYTSPSPRDLSTSRMPSSA